MSKDDNVVDIDLARALKLLKEGKNKEADEAYNRFKERAGRFDKNKEKK